MAGTLKINNAQLGDNGTATNNFTWYQPATPDGTVRLGVGNAGATSADVLTANNSGNVGIGTSSPAARLHVDAGASAEVQRFNTTSTTPYMSWYVSGTRKAYQQWDASYGWILDSEAASTGIVFRTQNAERARIDSSGNLLVGTTSATDGGGLCVSKSYNGATIANFYNSFGSGAQTLRTQMVAAASNTSSYHYVASSGGDKLFIYGNGNVVNVNGSYGTLSDEKLKENIFDASPKLEDVLRLRVRNFNLKSEPENKQIGFIAQEFEQVFPSMIDESPDRDADGKLLEETTKSIKTSVLVPILVKAIQELNAKVEAQAAEIAALKAG